jgi:hypothetical protein
MRKVLRIKVLIARRNEPVKEASEIKEMNEVTAETDHSSSTPHDHYWKLRVRKKMISVY